MPRHTTLLCGASGVPVSVLHNKEAAGGTSISHEAGCLFLVVGPSGAGKDSLLDAARHHFAGDPVLFFPERLITRPADAGGEAHIPIDPETFESLARSDGFALHWRAHGHSYGISMAIRAALFDGRHVVVNVSRTVLDTARAKFSKVSVLSIVADPEVVAARLRVRGREEDNDIEARLARAALARPAGDDVVEIDNSGNLEEAEHQFIAAIKRLTLMHEADAAE
jgi:ribose 1,5-bisphosphokinase